MPIKLFCSDLDGTMLGNPESTRRFNDAWGSLPRKQRPLLSYNTGRLVDDVLKHLETDALPKPDYIISGLGTQLYDSRKRRHVAEFDKQFGEGWDLAKVEQILAAFPGVTQQPPEFLHPYKPSWFLLQATPEILDMLRRQLLEAGLSVTLVLDVLPANTGKGTALQWLCEYVNIRLKQVLVAGDSGNDSSMFLLPGVKGIVVENAQPELFEAVGP